ncbi:ran-binding protein 9-like isoform X1 [Ostrinia furnacalis]|uniref:ran-binding protein 9-like isoform X1 n=1 Tax=Ostrinia furnacalis TaxID=93504 RepID=UPI00103AE175|nr:ran-binding protein 9-like isoform X1 [Ostrinia furnacalis]
MAAMGSGRGTMDSQNQVQSDTVDRLKLLYPNVNEDETPLPRAWSTKDKFSYIGLSQNNLRVHYKGHGKTHKDAASVRATHPIPASCGLYYFEVRIVSKGRDGYMGIGLSAHGVNMNRLPGSPFPGWDKHSYGYHGDDGHSFCSSGTGQPYGPTFTTGDVIGCGVNLVDNTCFYTKNGHHLGIAFRGLPPNLYPTVGLQTPGEVVDANFGQQPFVFDIEDMLRELRARTRLAIDDFPLPDEARWQQVLHRMVSSYLVHHGYCGTAQAFARATAQPIVEDIASIKNRQRVSKLVLAGRIGEAIELTRRLYPGLLERDQDLLFLLKCRQFVEMVNGSDSEVSGLARCVAGAGAGCGCGATVIAHTGRPPATNGVQGSTSEEHTTNCDVDMPPAPHATNGAHAGNVPRHTYAHKQVLNTHNEIITHTGLVNLLDYRARLFSANLG